MAEHPAYFRPNIWPSADLPALEQAFKQLGQLIVSVGMLLTSHCDRYEGRLFCWRFIDNEHSEATKSFVVCNMLPQGTHCTDT